MTRINVTIQERNGKLTITNIQQNGDELPKDKWEKFVLETSKIFD